MAAPKPSGSFLNASLIASELKPKGLNPAPGICAVGAPGVAVGAGKGLLPG